MKNIITINSSIKISHSNNNVIITDSDERQNKIPINEIECIIIDNNQLSITISLINLCSTNNVPIVICNSKHTPYSEITPIHQSYNEYLKLHKQIKWTESRKNNLYLKILQRKILHQIQLLNHFNINSVKIKDLLETINKTNMLEVESQCARIYFKQLYGNKFKRFDEDELNYALNYGYSILRSIIRQQIVAKGLHPSISLNHHNQFNNFNLSDDIIEVFRPMVDYISFLFLYKDSEFTYDEKKILSTTTLSTNKI